MPNFMSIGCIVSMVDGGPIDTPQVRSGHVTFCLRVLVLVDSCVLIQGFSCMITCNINTICLL